MKEIMDFLKEEGISPKLIQEVQEFSAAHPVKDGLKGRIPVPHFFYYGKKVWEEALAALLCGKNLLLAGEKATGKNVLASGCSFRPSCMGHLISCKYGCIFAYRYRYFQKREG